MNTPIAPGGKLASELGI